jgi:NitT/TauT family transport system permease protein
VLTQSARFWTRFARSRLGLPVGGALSLLLFWQFVLPAAGVPQFIAPTPLQVAYRFSVDGRLLWDNFLPSLCESVLGFLAGNVAAISLAVLFVYSKPVERAYFPVVLFLNTIPVLAISAFIVMILGK